MGVDHLAVGNVGGAPGTVVIGDEVEQRLVSDEDGRQREADDGADEEALGAHAFRQKLFRHTHLSAVPAAVLRLGAGNDESDANTGGKGHCQSDEDAFGEEIGKGVRRIEAVDGDGQVVELGQEGEAEGDAALFNALLAEYVKAPKVTKRRLYLETMSEILPLVESKIIIDESTQGILPLLQLDKTGGPVQ